MQLFRIRISSYFAPMAQSRGMANRKRNFNEGAFVFPVFSTQNHSATDVAEENMPIPYPALQIDRQSWVESQLLSVGIPLTQPGMLYIGGYEGALPHHLEALSGFHGCVKKIRLNGKSVLLRAGAGQHVRECGMDPCALAACPRACTSNNDDFVCLCEWPKYGRTCEQGEWNLPPSTCSSAWFFPKS
ncbi:hypothetical protein NECAME_07032 [Necator americanus]|uniref:Laminin G domain-containing protein n=1 Tax=Necator americanus TaxID=51031 RepID=W2TQT3_NECAM|nr:hypothetical protein NECAME_07032 [Necator americanus]ETN84148.1 hypothetical protein NECAME_07032 [Necator americanus]